MYATARKRLIGERVGTEPTCGVYVRIKNSRRKVKVAAGFEAGVKFAMGVGGGGGPELR